MNKKKILKIAKAMLKQSLNQGSVDSNKVQQVLKETIAKKPKNLVNILKKYKKLIQTALSQEEVIVETATPIVNRSPRSKGRGSLFLNQNKKDLEDQIIAKTGARRVSYKTNPKIVLGAKITHGDWIWDASLDAKLRKLTNAE